MGWNWLGELEMCLWNASRKNKQSKKGLLTHQQDFDNAYRQHWWLLNCQAKIRINILLSLFLIQDVFYYSFAQGYSSGDFTSVKQTGLEVFLNKVLWSNHLTPPVHRHQAIQSLLLPVYKKKKMENVRIYLHQSFVTSLSWRHFTTQGSMPWVYNCTFAGSSVALQKIAAINPSS